jgi:hypothetical protein
MTIIRTGAIIGLPEYNKHCHADVHQVGNCYVFVTGVWYHPDMDNGARHADVQVQHGIRRTFDDGGSIIIVPMDRVLRHTDWDKAPLAVVEAKLS